MTVDELQVLITANTTELQKEISKTQQSITNLQKTTSKSTSSISKSFKFLKVAIAGLGIGKLISTIFGNMDDAVSRLDTINNYSNVMSNLGVSTNDADASIQRLSDKLTGLPTTLNDAVSSVQRFTSTNGNVKASTDMFLALNNAILSGGASTEIQASALEQLSQAYAKGKPDMQEWRTAMTAMPAQLKQVAQAMGYISADKLGEDLRNGKVSMNEFMKTITKLNKEGVNGFQSFEQQAKNSTGGVKTSITNVKTALTRGLAEIMNAIGQSNIAGFFQGIASAINKVIPYITGFVKACVWAITSILSIFGKKTKTNVDNTSKSINNLSTSIGSTSDGLDDATSSAKKLNKELNGLTSFDEMNVLEESDNNTGANSSSGGVDLGNLDFIDWDTPLDNLSNKTDKIAEKIKKVFKTVGDFIKSIWNSGPVQAYSNAVLTYWQFLYNGITTIGSNLVTNLQGTWTNIQDNVNTAISNMSTFWTNFWTDIANGIETWGQPIIDGVSGLFNSIYQDYIDPVLQIISNTWADFSGILVSLWEKHGKTLIDNLGEFVTNIITLFQSIWDNILGPIITPFLEEMSLLWDEHISKLITAVGDFVGTLINDALEIYNKFIQPIILWLIDKLAPAWAFLSSTVIGIVGTIRGVIADLLSGTIKKLTGIIDFITGVFTGNWKKAWDGIKSIFTGIWESLTGVVKGVINIIIDVLNGFVSSINKIKFDVPTWVPVIGGKKWGFNIPKIPKLAQGGIVDKPTYAMIGEAGTEAVMPLEHNTGWIDKLADRLSEKIGNNSSSPIQLIVKIGEDTLLDKIIKGMKDKDFETNGEVFDL